MKPRKHPPTLTERVTTWIGSRSSVIVHTFVFIGFFLAVVFEVLSLETMLLVLTTAVSLEAIYLAIFIQMTVNANTASLREVEEDIDEIQEDVEELGEDLDEIQEDIGEIQEDVEEMSEESDEKETGVSESELLEKLSRDVSQLLTDLEALKKK